MNKKAPKKDIDVEFEDTEEVLAEENFQEKIKKLRAELKASKEKCEEYLTGWQRDKAEFINARKRDEDTKKNVIAFAKESLILDLLPVIDSFDMAMANKEVWGSVDENWRVGVEYIYNQLNSVLSSSGVTEIKSTGSDFDPNIHDSVEEVKVEDSQKVGIVTETLQKGYILGEKVLRPAKVKIGGK